MRLLAFLLIIAESFILFNSAGAGGTEAGERGRRHHHNQEPPSHLIYKQYDNERPSGEQVIRGARQHYVGRHWDRNWNWNRHWRHQQQRHERSEWGPNDDIDHHSAISNAQLPLDNALASATLGQARRETNPLIESALDEELPTGSLLSSAANNQLQQHRHHRRRRHQRGHRLRERRSGQSVAESIRPADGPLQAARVRSSYSSHSGARDWCQRDCSTSLPGGRARKDGSVCASDGRLYGSMCELRRHACRHNLPLFRRPASDCPRKGNASEEVRMVELRSRCKLAAYEEMKALLLADFDGDIGAMFKYFDTNGDRYIEAHELWPRNEGEPGRLVYAQIWDHHFAGCHHSPHLQLDQTGAPRLPIASDSSKCWYFLDFAFEPKYAANPCSLSHLMLFELSHPNSKFSYESFEQAFASLKTHKQMNSSEPDRMSSPVSLRLGDAVSLSCQPDASFFPAGKEAAVLNNDDSELREEGAGQAKCSWTRYNLNLATIQDAHMLVELQPASTDSGHRFDDLVLHLKDAQLYLSGPFKCSCNLDLAQRPFEHLYNVQVSVRPHFQWSLPSSRASFECHYDYIDTSNAAAAGEAALFDGEIFANSSEAKLRLQVKWLKDNQRLVVDGKQLSESSSLNETPLSLADDDFGEAEDSNLTSKDEEDKEEPSECSERATISMASSRMTLENLCSNDTGLYTCRVGVNIGATSTGDGSRLLVGQDQARLLVQERPKSGESDLAREGLVGSYLLMFHDNGISVYRLQNDDGQEMELLREINGHSLVSGEVDGNWNQLTLCGGLNPEQVVICEWSDNALYIDANYNGDKSKTRRYIYVGQPNLNRVIVMEGAKFEIVAIINTEPQPRKLYLYKPSKVHLSKWVRRRLSPNANARWLSAIGTLAHSLDSTPVSRLYSTRQVASPALAVKQKRESKYSGPATYQLPSTLLQHDIWLLCYGQPLVVNPSGDEYLEDSGGGFYSDLSGATAASWSSAAVGPAQNGTVSNHNKRLNAATIQPFTPRLTAGQPLVWSIWPNKEARLRNRKSVHIIQTTFFPQPDADEMHNHDHEPSGWRREKNDTVVGEFKRSTVLTTHHVFAGLPNTKSAQRYLAQPQYDLIQDLFVPPKPRSLEKNEHHKIHHAYVTHYNERRLYRVSMDEYRYDRKIDLQNCDPINLMTTAQGLLIVQCRASITHNLIGQLVLDELSGSRIEFNANIRAQESYLSPDNRYLISIYTNSTPTAAAASQSISASDFAYSNHVRKKSVAAAAAAAATNQSHHRGQSIIFVQLVTVSGLKLQYEIKTSLEISQCSFVWKDGYYAAIFVSTNRTDQQSEILSLRLLDSRLELMARVPGIVSSARHKDQLIVSPELQLAALSTNQGTYVVDLEDNRVSQSLRHHQSPPTLLWV